MATKKKARLLTAATDALKALQDAAGDEPEVEMVSEVALAMMFALAERAGIGDGDMAPDIDTIKSARDVLFGGRQSYSDAHHVREIAEALRPFVRGEKVERVYAVSATTERKLRRYARAHGVDLSDALTEIARIATDRPSFDLTKRPSLKKLQRQLRRIDPALVTVDLTPYIERLGKAHLGKGYTLSGVITDLLIESKALGTSGLMKEKDEKPAATRANVAARRARLHKKVSAALAAKD